MMTAVVIFVACVVVVIGWLAFGPRGSTTFSATHEDVAKAIEDFLDGSGGDHDWDDFLHWKITDPFLESVRKKCEDAYDEYPATQHGHYCSDEGVAVLRALLKEVREKATAA